MSDKNVTLRFPAIVNKMGMDKGIPFVEFVGGDVHVFAEVPTALLTKDFNGRLFQEAAVTVVIGEGVGSPSILDEARALYEDLGRFKARVIAEMVLEKDVVASNRIEDARSALKDSIALILESGAFS